MAGPHITPMLPLISSGPGVGTDRNGIPGIKGILTTGTVSVEITPIGEDINTVTIMTGNFMSSTTMARVGGGIKDTVMIEAEPRRA